MALPVVIRKNAAKLTKDEIKRYVDAVKTLNTHKDLTVGSPVVASKDSLYRIFMMAHNDIVNPAGGLGGGPGSPLDPFAHANILFLAWHRIFLYEFELQLRKADMFNRSVTNSDLAIPYWNWNVQRAIKPGAGGELWTDKFMGPSGDPADSFKLKKGPFKDVDFEIEDVFGNTAIIRQFGAPGGLLSGKKATELCLECHFFDIKEFGAGVDAIVTTEFLLFALNRALKEVEEVITLAKKAKTDGAASIALTDTEDRIPNIVRLVTAAFNLATRFQTNATKAATEAATISAHLTSAMALPALITTRLSTAKTAPAADFPTKMDDAISTLEDLKKEVDNAIKEVKKIPVGEIGKAATVSSFRATLERFNHNTVHNWAGGSLTNVYTSPNDPLFYLLHCNVDRIWKKWQIKHLSKTVKAGFYKTLVDQYPSMASTTNPNALGLSINLRPWNAISTKYPRTWNTNEVLNWRTIGTKKAAAVAAFAADAHDYIYDDDPKGLSLP